MKQKWLLLLMLTLVMLAGCIQNRIIEDILLIQGLGFDTEEGEKILGTFSYAKFTGSSSSSGAPGRSEVNQYIQAEGGSTKEIESEVNRETALPVELGQLRVVAFGKNFASFGTKNEVNTLIRDPEVGTQIYLVVADGKAADLFSRNYNGISTAPAMYIAEMIKQNIQTQNVPKTNLHAFAYQLYGVGVDPVLPIIGLDRLANRPVIKGLALFDEDHYVGKVAAQDMFIFKRMDQDSQSGVYALKMPGGEKIVTREIVSSQSFDIKHLGTVPSVKINVKIEGAIVEATDELNLTSKKALKQIEKTMEKKLEKRGEELIKRFQKLGVDPFGIGDHVRSKDRQWDPKKWESLYPEVDISVDVKVDIKETGTVN